MKYLALLRGINVGGNNIIKKDQLKKCFQQAGLTSVLTYIQSGNILFQSSETSKPKLQQAIQKQLQNYLGKTIQLTLFTKKEYQQTLKTAHPKWGKDPNQKHNALFILDGQNPQEVINSLPSITPSIEKTTSNNRAIFWSIAKDHYTKSNYTKTLIKTPAYKQVTIRNSNTTFKLQELFERI